MKKLTVVLILFIIINFTYAQSTEQDIVKTLSAISINTTNYFANDPDLFTAIDEHALSAPDSVRSSVKELAAYLTDPAENDLLKVRSIFRWITSTLR